MATPDPKRKRESGQFDSGRLRKRQKSVNYHEESQSSRKHSSQSTQNSGAFYSARAILDEKVADGKKRYLVDWEGTDPATGKAYEPTWERASNCNAALKKAWLDQRRGSQTPSLARQDEPQADTKRNSRRRKVIESSPPTSTKSASPLPSAAVSTRENSVAVSARDSFFSPAASPQFQPDHGNHIEVVPSQKTNFDLNKYIAVSSQLVRSPPVSSQLQPSADSSYPEHSTPRPRDAVIPDSQPSSPELLPSDKAVSKSDEIPTDLVSRDPGGGRLVNHLVPHASHVLLPHNTSNIATSSPSHRQFLQSNANNNKLSEDRADNKSSHNTKSPPLQSSLLSSTLLQPDRIEVTSSVRDNQELTANPQALASGESDALKSSLSTNPPNSTSRPPSAGSISGGQRPDQFSATSTQSQPPNVTPGLTQRLPAHTASPVSAVLPLVRSQEQSSQPSSTSQPSTPNIDWDSFYRAASRTSTQGETPTASHRAANCLTHSSQLVPSTKYSAENQQAPTTASIPSIVALDPSSVSSPPPPPTQEPESLALNANSDSQTSANMPARRSGRVPKPSGSATPSGEVTSSSRPTSQSVKKKTQSRRKPTVRARAIAADSPAGSSSTEKVDQVEPGELISIEGDDASSSSSPDPKQESSGSSPKPVDGAESTLAAPFMAREISAASAEDAVPAKDASPVRRPLSRSSTSSPAPSATSSPRSMRSKSLSPVTEKGPKVEKMEFIVPVPINGSAQDQYRKTIEYNEPVIRKFCARTWPDDSEIHKQAEGVVQALRDIALNTDLTNFSLSKEEANKPSLVAGWYRQTSSKFNFLSQFLDLLRQQPVHVVVVWKREGLGSMLETLFTGMGGIRFARAEQIPETQSEPNQSPLSVTLLNADGTGVENITKAPDVLITLDSSIHIDQPFIQSLRKLTRDPLRPVPTLSLLAVDSVDHVERSVATSFDPTQKLRLVLHSAAALIKVAGKLKGQPPIQEAVERAAQFILMKAEPKQWPLPPIGRLADNDVWALVQAEVPLPASQLDTGHSISPSEKKKYTQLALQYLDFFSATQKRGAPEDDEEPPSPKRMRMSPPEHDASTTRISDSAAGPSSNIQQSTMNSIEQSWWREQVKAEKTRAQQFEAGVKTNEELLRAQTKRLEDSEKTVSELQFRYEDQSKETRSMKNKIEELEASLAQAQKQKESRDNTIVTLKEDIAKMRTELTSARDLLSKSESPEIRELEELRKARDDAEEKARKANRRAEETEQLSGYLRQQYNEAGERAAELSEENEEYRTRLQKFEKTASGEVTKAREMSLQNHAKVLITENQRLKMVIAERERHLQRKEEELKQRRIPIATRGGSVPRSPHIGPNSRAGSPAPDRRVGALKGNK